MDASEEAAANLLPVRTMSGTMQSMEKMMPHFSDTTFWLFVNFVLFLYVGIFQLAHGYGPGSIYSAGAVVLAILYLVLWMYRKSDKKLADQLIMCIAGLAILGDLIVVGWVNYGSFSGDSALLDAAGLLLFHSSYKEYRG